MKLSSFQGLVAAAFSLSLPAAHAGLENPKGLWQLNGNFLGAQSGYSPLQTPGLVNGSDYSFGTDGAGYQYLQTQIFSTSAKRLTATQFGGVNGGGGSTKTNQWSVMMDVKFDSVSPYAGLLQLDPDNAQDVTFYLAPSSTAGLATLYVSGAALSWGGGIAIGSWQRITITCGNDGAGGPPSLQCYVNGVSSGFATPTTLNGPHSMSSTFHVLTDDNAELQPAKLGFLGVWSDRLSAAEVAKLGGPAPAGASLYLMGYPDAPATWGAWNVDTYYGMTPRMISATTDPDGRLRSTFVNSRAPASGNNNFRRQTLMFSYCRGTGGYRQEEVTSLSYGLPLGTPNTQAIDDDYVWEGSLDLPLRTKVVSADRGNQYEVRASVTVESKLSNIQSNYFVFAGNPPSFTPFPRKPWARGADNYSYDVGQSDTQTPCVTASAAGSVTTKALAPNNQHTVQIESLYRIGQQSFQATSFADYGQGITNSIGRIHTMDSALTDDGKDCYYLLNTALQDPTTNPFQVRSALTVVHQNLATPTSLGATAQVIIDSSNYPNQNVGLNSMQAYQRILVTRSTGEPKWVVWTNRYTNRTQVAKRLVPLPDEFPATVEDRRITAGYQILPAPIAFSDGSDAALDGLDRLHFVWWNPLSGEITYARENSAGTFDQMVLPIVASAPPAITIGPGDYPYIVYAGANTSNPGESAPLIITCPQGLIAAFRGDNEDQDGDGRSGLVERVQGSADTLSERGQELRQLVLTPNLATTSPGVQKFEAGFRLKYNSVRNSSTSPVWYQADGADTLAAQLEYSYNGMQTWGTGGFTLAEEFTVNNVLRYVTVRDTPTTTQQPRAFYRLGVKRTPGRP